MKDAKFTELLNLYLDHEISPADAALLETEIQRDPARRRLYRQYCQMQKACTVLAEDFRTEAPEAGSVAQFPVRGRNTAARAIYAVGAIAAAACVAFVVMNRQPAGTMNTGAQLAASPSVATQTQLAQTEPSARPMLTMPAAERRSGELQTVFTTQALAQLNQIPVNDALAAEANRLRYEWMNQVQLSPVQLEQAFFETMPANAADGRAFGSKRPFDAQVEMTAYRFQR